MTDTHAPHRIDAADQIRPPLLSRLQHYFEFWSDTTPDAIAIHGEFGEATYSQLDRRANQVAHVLQSAGVAPGSRVGLLLERSPLLYWALLGALKAGAAFVPMDPQTPTERLHYLAADSEVDVLLTQTSLLANCEDLTTTVLPLDQLTDELDGAETSRPELPDEELPTAYIIYTSGSTGLPKGVEIAHASICNFLHHVPTLYDLRSSDRVYQGITISFDFAIEEIWPAWASGAALVVGPPDGDGRRVGEGLARFLTDHEVTMLFCVPTVLATIERDIPSIRGLFVGGEACPAELVERWAPGRRMLNTYGPTEATVTCTVAELRPGRPVTIGVPVPSYTAIILDEQGRPVPDGEVGELAVGGVGVAKGYLKRPELTAQRFIPHPVDPSLGRIYRTGDLAKVQDDGEIVYLGRADSEVKIRGHRVDLGEIESVMMRDPLVPSAAVKHLSSGELAAYLVLGDTTAAAGIDHAQVIERLHTNMQTVLPPYMIPAFIEVIAELPMLISGKVDRKSLPDPTAPRLLSGGPVVAPSTADEAFMRSIWAEVLGVDEDDLSVTADFFNDLGGHSLLAANVTSRLRTDARGAGMSVMDLYANPTIEKLAEFLSLRGHSEGQTMEPSVPVRPRAPRPSGIRVAAFGAAQVTFIFALYCLLFAPVSAIYWWHDGVASLVMLQHLAITFPLTYLGSRWLLPLIISRTAGHGLKEGEYPLFGLVHLRVWLVEKAMMMSPLNNLAGSAFAAGYLRAAGAWIADGTHIGTTRFALPSMVDLGSGVSLGYACHLQGYDIANGVLSIGRVRLGNGATVGAQAVIVGPAELGARSYLAPQSTLPAGAVTGADETWEGSPAVLREAQGDLIVELMQGCPSAPTQWSAALKKRFLGGLVALEMAPLAALLPAIILVWWALVTIGDLAGLVATLLTGPLFVITTCALILWLRRFGLPVTPVGVRHLRSSLGVDKWFADRLLEMSLLLTNTLYATLYTPPWLRRLGAHIGRRAEVATIANIDPDLLHIGEESFIADMANVGGATYCNHHVAFRPTVIGRRTFVGNSSFVPSGAELGDDALLGVASVPPHSGIQDGSAWLGSPSFYLPRREMFEEYGEDVTFSPPRMRIIERYVIEALRITLPSTLLATATFCTLWLAGAAAGLGAPLWAMFVITALAALLCSLGVAVVVALLKWVVIGRYRPRVEPMWSRWVRRTELVTGAYEAAAVPIFYSMLSGTPLMGPALRLLGAKVGRRTLVCSTYMTEFDLIRLGDDVVVHPEVSLQTHLFEDRVMKMNIVDIGERVDVGTRSIVLYSTRLADDVALAPLTLVMKGEQLPDGTHWAGIPAQQLTMKKDSR